MSKYNVYIIAYVSGNTMLPISKIYRNLGVAQNKLEELKENYNELKILVANNWHDLEEQK